MGTNGQQDITFTYEISRGCNLNCVFCYNTWKIDGRTAEGQLTTKLAVHLLDKVIDETGCSSICLSGGEPLLREDIFEIIAFIRSRNVKVSLVSNGALLTSEAVDKCLESGVDAFQVTLLADKPGLHNHLSGGDSFERVVESILSLKEREANVSTFFVATADNVAGLGKTLELNVLLGVRNVAIGRFTPGGAGLKGWGNLMPAPGLLQTALESASAMCRRYPLAVSISTPVLPCLNDVTKYENIRLGFCAVGDKQSCLFAIDPMGNLKVCSHSGHILGSLLEEPFAELVKAGFYRDFIETLPEYCRDCPASAICKGGCRSSAHLCYGSLADEDPYLHKWKARASKDTASRLMMRKDSPGGAADD
jgi:radical SAM protein with 4Fe4S-binding SPASM domain